MGNPELYAVELEATIEDLESQLKQEQARLDYMLPKGVTRNEIDRCLKALQKYRAAQKLLDQEQEVV